MGGFLFSIFQVGCCSCTREGECYEFQTGGRERMGDVQAMMGMMIMMIEKLKHWPQIARSVISPVDNADCIRAWDLDRVHPLDYVSRGPTRARTAHTVGIERT